MGEYVGLYIFLFLLRFWLSGSSHEDDWPEMKLKNEFPRGKGRTAGKLHLVAQSFWNLF